MGKKTREEYARYYKQIMENDDLQAAYEMLMRYMSELRSYFRKSLSYEYEVGNVSPGYMDYTYFPFYNQFLRNHKLRFGVVLNHRKVQFELWLMGQNEEIQRIYWDILKDSKWNEGVVKRPIYSVLEKQLIEEPDFSALDVLSEKIMKDAVGVARQVEMYLEKYVESMEAE